jgi:DNA-binding MarR family transcriptional regulator
MTDADLGATFTELYAAVYLRFHRRRGKGGPRLTARQWAILQHLALSGPLTVGECARHLDRAQSVVSEIVDGLEGHRLLERMRDARDRRRVLVWLSDAGQRYLARERQVLDVDRLAGVAARMSAADKRALLTGMRALVRAADRPHPTDEEKRR